MRSDPYLGRLFLVLSFFFILHLLKSLFLRVHVDEANWWMQSEHLAAGYFFHPPMTAFVTRLSTVIFGEGVLGLRMVHLMLATATLGLAYRLGRELGWDGRTSLLAVVLLAVLPLTNYWITMVVPDTSMIFFAFLTAIFSWRAVSGKGGKNWYWAGMSAGLMLLTKLQSFLFLAGMFAFLLTSRRHRRFLKEKEPYLGLAVTLAMMIPTVAWYAYHRFEPIISQLTTRPGFLDAGVVDYLLEVAKHVGWEMIALSPFVYLFSLFGLIYGGYTGYRWKRADLLYLFWLAFPGILFFTVTGGPPRWGFSHHLFSLMLATGSVSILISRSRHASAGKLWKLTYSILFVALSILISGYAIYANARSSSVHTGWEELSREVDELGSEMYGATGKTPVVAAPYYFIPSEIAYHNRGKPAQYTLAFRVYENEVMCDNSNYAPWVPLDRLEGRDFIFVDERLNPDGFDTPLSYWEEKLQPYFREVRPPEVFREDGEGGERCFYIFACYGFRGPDARMDEKGEVRSYVAGAR